MSAPLQQPQQLVTTQQNEVHHHQQQPPITTTTIDFMDLINSGFETLYKHSKDLDEAADKHMRLKYDILLNCLNAKEWKAVQNHCGEDIFVHPEYVPKFVEYGDRDTAATDDDGFDFENSIEGVAFVQPFNYGHQKSGKTLDLYNELYAREVLGSEIGRRLIQQHLPTPTLSSTPMEVDQVQNDNSKKLVNDTFNYILGSLKGLSIGGGTNLRQIDDALSVSTSVQELLEVLKDRHLEMEKKKRPLDLVPQNELVPDNTHDEKKQRTTDTKQGTAVKEDDISTSVPMEEDSDVSVVEDASQTVEFEFENTTGNTSNASVKEDGPEKYSPSMSSMTTLQDDFDTTSDNESDDEVTIDGTVSDNVKEDDNDESIGAEIMSRYNKQVIIDNCTKMDIFAPALYWLDVMMENADVSPAITKRIGIIYQSQYEKVIALIKSALPSSTEEETADPNATFVSVSSFNNEQLAQLDAICKETAQLIQDEFPGYTGDLLESIELMLLGRVSTRTGDYNDGKSQGASLLAIIKLLYEKKHFKLPVVLNKRFMLAIGYDRKYPERCDALYEAIKATLFSKYRAVQLFINDSLRTFYGSVQHRYFHGVLKALNPKRDIDISFGSNGLMPTDGNEPVIDTINTREQKYKDLETKISHISASKSVLVDPNSTDPPQTEIDALTKELYESWRAAGRIPDKYKDAITRGKEYTIKKKERQLTKRDYGAGVQNSRNRLKALRFNQLTLNDQKRLKAPEFDQLTLHGRSLTEKGSSILQEESNDYCGSEILSSRGKIPFEKKIRILKSF